MVKTALRRKDQRLQPRYQLHSRQHILVLYGLLIGVWDDGQLAVLRLDGCLSLHQLVAQINSAINLVLCLRIMSLYLLQMLMDFPHRILHITFVVVKCVFLQLLVYTDIALLMVRVYLLFIRFHHLFLLFLPLLRIPLYLCHLLAVYNHTYIYPLLKN